MLSWMHFNEWDAGIHLLDHLNSAPESASSLPYGDGKPIIIVPRSDLGPVWVYPLTTLLRALGYRAVVVQPSKWSPNGMLSDVAGRRALTRLTSVSSRKAVLIGHGDGIRQAFALAQKEPDHVQAMVGLGAPEAGGLTEKSAISLKDDAEGWDLRLIAAGREWLGQDAAPDWVNLVKGPPSTLVTNPAAQAVLMDHLVRIGVELTHEPDPGIIDD